MAYTTIDNPGLYFNTKLHTGNGSSQSITGVGFSPDFVWLKVRSTTGDHGLFDTVRGTTKFIRSNKTNDEATSDSISSFDSDGFSLGAGWNDNSATFASWNWKGGTTASGSTSGSGTAKTYNSSTSVVSGFSIVKYVGNGTANHQFPHGLGVKPDMVFIKNLDDDTTNWQGYNRDLTATKSFKLNSSDSPATTNSVTNDVEPTTTVFNLGSAGDANANDQEHIAYLFAEKQGFSKVGQYTGNGNANGTFLYLGFLASFIIIKDISSTDPWHIIDNKRSPINLVNARLFANTNGSENTSADICDFLSNGIKFRGTNDGFNGSRTYMYMAFAESPFVNSNKVPNNAR
jgi:hypothetical protein